MIHATNTNYETHYYGRFCRPYYFWILRVWNFSYQNIFFVTSKIFKPNITECRYLDDIYWCLIWRLHINFRTYFTGSYREIKFDIHNFKETGIDHQKRLFNRSCPKRVCSKQILCWNIVTSVSIYVLAAHFTTQFLQTNFSHLSYNAHYSEKWIVFIKYFFTFLWRLAARNLLSQRKLH
jgi:hypothetical protein